MKTTLLIGILLLGCASHAQTPADGGTLTRETFVKLVLKNHPIARQATLRTGLGEATVRSARGGFDPMATASYAEKRFDGFEYFEIMDAGLKVPTWFGVDLVGGFQNTDGFYLNPQGTTPDNGLIKAGVEVPIGQGLFMDQRRATLRKAQAYQRGTEGERQEMLNQLLLTALGDHTDWVATYEQLRISDTAVVLASRRFDQVRGSFRGGDRPAIDTLEAYLQVQDRLMRKQQAQLDHLNAGLRLSNHLWDDAQRPLELQPGITPVISDLASPIVFTLADSSIARAIEIHPMLQRSQARIDQIEVDRRLRAEFLKPQLDLKYNWLGNGGALSNEPGTTLLGDGHQLGVGFQMPLLLRRERGELTLAKLRLTDAELSLERDQAVIRNKILERRNDIATYRKQTDLGAEMVTNHTRLLNAETQRFEVGESSLFIVNGREVPLIESRLKQVAFEAKLRKAYFALDHDAGTLWNAWTNNTTQP
ncbi:MAG TPA: TolC family protein [Flavobacteriales bacterium]|nr:TolC family protein [Flavobacteriales bacterium]